VLSVLSVARLNLTHYRSSSFRSGPARACYDRQVVEALVPDLIRVVGYAALKLVTFGWYKSGKTGLYLEGCLGLVLLGAMFFFLSKFVL
jgi:hypothetical protein